MKVKVVLSINDKLVKGTVVDTEETYRHMSDNGTEEGYDVLLVEGDEIIVDIGGEQYAPSVIENGMVLEWMPYQDNNEYCYTCSQAFREDSMISALYGLLFCSNECALERFPDADLDDIEILLASDIGVK